MFRADVSRCSLLPETVSVFARCLILLKDLNDDDEYDNNDNNSLYYTK